MRIVFFGTPEFAVPSLDALAGAGHDIAAVVSQPDRARGRSRSILLPPPVKARAQETGLAVLQPDRPTGDVFAAALRRLAPELGVVVAYGHILRPEILEIPTHGMINVHASLLPRHRGASPIQTAILEGDAVTGVSVMQMEAGLDSGPVLGQRQTPIAEHETAGELGARLAELGAEALVEAVAAIAEGKAEPRAQDESGASYAPKLNRTQARLDWQAPAVLLARRIRAYDPVPGAWTTMDGADVKLFDALAGPGGGRPGEVLAAGDTLLIATGEGTLEVRRVQPSGRTPMPVKDWVRGRGVRVGDCFA